MKVDFDANEDSQAQAILLVNALTEWLVDQSEQEPRSGRVNFTYRPDGTLDSVRTVLDEPKAGV
ncbi:MULTISPECIES: hypothetical protein [unclassified Pseudomonas]|uniref:hypothetical protein n=1 Tax=unclassified Pseudomonas TaxID=196821 RepID=UPI001CBD838B|nr:MULTISPECIES: hypothetical protein [unclassified Pseudomonas]